MIIVRGNGARHVQVLDGGSADEAEGGGALVVVVGNRGGDGLAVAVEGAAEGFVVTDTHHRRHVDVGVQLHRCGGGAKRTFSRQL